MKSANIIILIIFIPFFTSCNNDLKTSPVESKSENLLKFELLEDKISDTPGKTQILTNIVIEKQDSITNEKIVDLLISLYQERTERTGFTYRNTPNAVAIYAYLSKEKAQAGLAQWIAMLTKMPKDEKYEISFNEFSANSLKEKEQPKWDLSYQTRKEIWNRIIISEREAQREADVKHPIVAGISKEDFMKNGNLAEKLRLRKEEEIIRDFKITRTTLDSIGLEGLYYDWVFPKNN